MPDSSKPQSADPQSDLLSSFLSGQTDFSNDAQKSVKQTGGVAIEDTPAPQSTRTQAPAETPPSPAKSEEVEDGKSEQSNSDVFDDIDLPDDVAKKQNIPAKAEVSTDDEPVPDEVQKRGRKGVDAWTAAKREAKEYKKQLEELETRLKQVESESSTNEELTKLQTRLEEAEKAKTSMEDRLGQMDVTFSAAFKQQYDKPLNDLFARSMKTLTSAGVDQKTARDVVINAMQVNNTPEKLQDLLQDFPPTIQGAVYQNAIELIEGQKRRASAIKDWRNTQAAVREQEQRAYEVKSKEIVAQNVDSAIDTLRSEGSWLFSKSNTDDSWNQKVDERVKTVKGIMKTATPDVLAKYVADGLASKTYRKLYEKQLSEFRKLQREVSSRSSVRPGLGGSGSFDGSEPEDKSKPVRADDWLSANLAGR